MLFSNIKKKYYYYIIIVILIVLLFEFLLKFYGLGNPIIYKTNLSYRYAPIPNQSVDRFNGSKVTINSDGLRATQEWNSTNKNKILFFGDSVTYGGSYIDDKETFSELTCNILKKNNKNNHLCGNAGVNAYGIDNISNRILYGEVQDQQWTVVILNAEDGFRSLQNILAIPAFLNKPRIFPAIQELFLHITWKTASILRGGYKFNYKNNFNFFFQESFSNLNNILINQTQKGKKVLVVFHASKEEIINNKESKERLLMKNILQSKISELLFLDIFPIINQSNGSNFYYDDIHLNKNGHIFFAEQISKMIHEHNNNH
jgi:lysophospholipase L1-like esterase